jgi:hypothetical protein
LAALLGACAGFTGMMQASALLLLLLLLLPLLLGSD